MSKVGGSQIIIDTNYTRMREVYDRCAELVDLISKGPVTVTQAKRIMGLSRGKWKLVSRRLSAAGCMRVQTVRGNLRMCLWTGIAAPKPPSKDDWLAENAAKRCHDDGLIVESDEPAKGMPTPEELRQRCWEERRKSGTLPVEDDRPKPIPPVQRYILEWKAMTRRARSVAA